MMTIELFKKHVAYATNLLWKPVFRGDMKIYFWTISVYIVFSELNSFFLDLSQANDLIMHFHFAQIVKNGFQHELPAH